MSSARTKSRRFVVATGVVLVVGSAVSLCWSLWRFDEESRTLATVTAQTLFRQLVVTRRWNAEHGGLYAFTTEKFRPNPYLKDPDRDLVTVDGRTLTKINPAFMTRLLGDRLEQEGSARFHITGLAPLRPENAPDPWERRALEGFAAGAGPRSEVVAGSRGKLLRYMAPLHAERACLGCHASRGAREGRVLGGISVTLPYGPHEQAALAGARRSWLVHGVFLTVGLVLLVVFGRRLQATLRIAAGRASRIEKLLGEVRQEKKRSDALLHNILPRQTASELKRTGRARPRRYESASVMFLDFVDFSRTTQHLSPEELVGELDRIFSGFDRICARHGLEKIKTIGDGYLVVGGLPAENPAHARDCVLAGLDMLRLVRDMNAARGERTDLRWEARVGIATGPVVAGVIGDSKLAYDVFGDTVVTASRIETASAPGRLNVCARTYEAVRPFFACEPRGRVPAKGRAELEMIFVDGPLTEIANDETGSPRNDPLRRTPSAPIGGAGRGQPPRTLTVRARSTLAPISSVS